MKDVFVPAQFYSCSEFYFLLFQTHNHTLPNPKTLNLATILLHSADVTDLRLMSLGNDKPHLMLVFYIPQLFRQSGEWWSRFWLIFPTVHHDLIPERIKSSHLDQSFLPNCSLIRGQRLFKSHDLPRVISIVTAWVHEKIIQLQMVYKYKL